MNNLTDRIRTLAEATGGTVTVGHNPAGSGHTFAACDGTETEAPTLEEALDALERTLTDRYARDARRAADAAQRAARRADAIAVRSLSA